MLGSLDVEKLTKKVYSLLSDIGVDVPNEEITGICLKKGCKAGNGHRIRIPEELIKEMAAFQKKTQEEYERNHELVYTCGPDWAHHLIWTEQAENFRKEYKKSFSCRPLTAVLLLTITTEGAMLSRCMAVYFK